MKTFTSRKWIFGGLAILAGICAALLYVKIIPKGSAPTEAFQFLVSRTHDILYPTPTQGNWKKATRNPILYDQGNVYFDISAIRTPDSLITLFYSWRNCKGIGFARSHDGVNFFDRHLVLVGNPSSDWEKEVNRPDIHRIGNKYVMWYTGQTSKTSAIGIAFSEDLVNWTRKEIPVLSPTLPWEKTSVMCPSVLFDSISGKYRMWYSGGEQFEPDAIGYAESNDGIEWIKRDAPIFTADQNQFWEKHKVTACHVRKIDSTYFMAYVGFSDKHSAKIGFAKSVDGINWVRNPKNPIITQGNWKDFDRDAVYKPYILSIGNKSILYYNGRRNEIECIGAAISEAPFSW